MDVWAWGWCLLGKFICFTSEYFHQHFKYLRVTARMVCLLVLKFSNCLGEVFLYPFGCIHWCFNGDTTLLWVHLVLDGDTELPFGRYLVF